MDRVKSSMQQVPNAIPKVIRRTGANSLELEKENFERGQCCLVAWQLWNSGEEWGLTLGHKQGSAGRT
ncbi:hypothetical protein JOQ06_017588 [Pogonophryne albipinna]|uniref:Uncharacterized protein n=1 Tax=Pogonophryne albipinna TaxID=1090488 RepID=A0AAD6FJU7_9TELE|nr:hypothetical protein JOQ06_017588 [Pogonophryne albipinna]